MSTPNNHFTACPYSRVRVPGIRCVDDARQRPIVCAGIVSRPGVEIVITLIKKITAPKNHLTSSPNRGVSGSTGDQDARRHPAVGIGIVSPTGNWIDDISGKPVFGS